MTRFLKHLFKIAKLSRIAVFGGFRCGASLWFFEMFRFRCHFMCTAVIVDYIEKPRMYDLYALIFKVEVIFAPDRSFSCDPLLRVVPEHGFLDEQLFGSFCLFR